MCVRHENGSTTQGRVCLNIENAMCEGALALEPLGLAGMLQHMNEINRSLRYFSTSGDAVMGLYGDCLV